MKTLVLACSLILSSAFSMIATPASADVIPPEKSVCLEKAASEILQLVSEEAAFNYQIVRSQEGLPASFIDASENGTAYELSEVQVANGMERFIYISKHETEMVSALFDLKENSCALLHKGFTKLGD